MTKTAPFNNFMITSSNEQLLNRLRLMFDEPFNTVEDALEKMELDAESRVSHALDCLGIRATVKIDRKSLPAHESVGRTKYFTSYFSSVLDMKVLKRMLVRQLLERGQCKIRFYVDIQPIYNENNKIYALRYDIHWFEHGCCD